MPRPPARRRHAPRHRCRRPGAAWCRPPRPEPFARSLPARKPTAPAGGNAEPSGAGHASRPAEPADPTPRRPRSPSPGSSGGSDSPGGSPMGLPPGLPTGSRSGSDSGSPGLVRRAEASSPLTIAAIARPTIAAGTIASTLTLAIALAGMAGYAASLGSWTMVAPPLALIIASPADPSSIIPVSTTPTTRPSRAGRSRSKQHVDGRPEPILPRAYGQMDAAILDHQVMVGRRDQDRPFT